MVMREWPVDEGRAEAPLPVQVCPSPDTWLSSPLSHVALGSLVNLSKSQIPHPQSENHFISSSPHSSIFPSCQDAADVNNLLQALPKTSRLASWACRLPAGRSRSLTLPALTVWWFRCSSL